MPKDMMKIPNVKIRYLDGSQWSPVSELGIHMSMEIEVFVGHMKVDDTAPCADIGIDDEPQAWTSQLDGSHAVVDDSSTITADVH